MKKLLLLSLAAAQMVMTTGCVTNQKVATNQLGDEDLSCSDLRAENSKLDIAAEKAAENKGLNTANVAAVLFFWPAAVGNYMDADTAERLIDKRKTKIAELYLAKHCHASEANQGAM